MDEAQAAQEKCASVIRATLNNFGQTLSVSKRGAICVGDVEISAATPAESAPEEPPVVAEEDEPAREGGKNR